MHRRLLDFSSVYRGVQLGLLSCWAGASATAMAQTAAPVMVFNHLAGPLHGGAGDSDGMGSLAGFSGPQGIAADASGNIYVADTSSDTIRKVATSGEVTTLAGGVDQPGSADGTGTAARFNRPTCVAVDSSGNVYVGDSYNFTIRQISPAGVVMTLAGGAGQSGSTDAIGSAARFSNVNGLAVDNSGDVYVADTGNNTIRKIAPGGAVSTLAGEAGIPGKADGTGSGARFAYPYGVTVNVSGTVYVADSGNQTIRQITPAGVVTTLAGSPGQQANVDGLGSAARFGLPFGLAVDSAGNVYVADSANDTIRMVTPTGMVTTLAGSAGQTGSADGTGTSARFELPDGVAVDGAGNVYVADTYNDTIRKMAPGSVVTTLAGFASQPGSVDGVGSAARFSKPTGVAVGNSGSLCVADSVNETIRTVTPAGDVATLAGAAGQIGSADGTGSAARFNNPFGVATDTAGNVYVTDSGNATIRKITPAGTVTTLAGMAGQSGSADGAGTAARFRNPEGIAVDGAGNVYVADTGNETVRKISPTGLVATLAGRVGLVGNANGTGSAAQFSSPAGLAVDNAGNVYVADTYNEAIRKVTSGGVVTTLAGGQNGGADGTGSAAQFNIPFGLAVDSVGNVYVADTLNATIRAITPAGVVTTLGGLAGDVGNADGAGTAARFNNPIGIAANAAGTVFVADTINNAIREGVAVIPAGIATEPPASTVVVSGANVAWSVVATGDADTYQWYAGAPGSGTPIAGATGATLTLNDVLAASAGSYYVVVTNSVGSVTSTAANLQVNPAPQTITFGTLANHTYGDLPFNVSATASSGLAPTFSVTSGPATILGNQVTLTGAGAVTIQAAQAGDADFAAATPVAQSFSVAPAAAVVTLGGLNQTYTGAPLAATATSPSPVAGYTYTYTGINGTVYGPSTTAPTQAGTYTASAVVNDPNFTGSATGTLTIGAADQTVAFPALGSVVVGVPVTLSATASSGLTVSFTVLSGNATITGGTTLTINDINPVTIAAAQAGNADFDAAAPVTQSVTATPGSPQAYFGSSAGAAGASKSGARQSQTASVATNLGAVINGSGTGGVLAGYLSGVGAGFVVDFTLNQGEFTAVTTSLVGGGAPGQTLTFTGSLAAGVLSGTIEELGLTFSASADPGSGPSAADAGLYQAAGTAGGTSFLVVGTQGDVFGLAVMPAGVGAGAGAITANNAFTLTTTLGAAATLAGSIDPNSTAITGTITPVGGSAANFAGEASQNSPAIVPLTQTVAAGASPSLSVSALGQIQWQFDGANLPGATNPTLTLPNIGTDQAGTYTAVVVGTDGTQSSGSASVAVTTSSHLVNLSSRSFVGLGSQALVAGFVVSGPDAKQILIRGVGPTLATFSVGGALADPLLTLFDNTSTVIATNAGWSSPPVIGSSASGAGVQPATSQIFNQVYAFGLPAGSADTAMVATLPAAGYTAQVSGANGTTGIALVELYDADVGMPVAHLVNLSARAFVNTGSGVLVAGFVISGTSSETILVRGIGPALAAFGVTGALGAPQLAVFDAAGEAIATNTGWGTAPVPGASATPAGIQAATAPIMGSVYAFPLAAGSADCAMVVTLPPGSYTAEVSGLGGTTGIGLIEVYDLP